MVLTSSNGSTAAYGLIVGGNGNVSAIQKSRKQRSERGRVCELHPGGWHLSCRIVMPHRQATCNVCIAGAASIRMEAVMHGAHFDQDGGSALTINASAAVDACTGYASLDYTRYEAGKIPL